MTTVATPTSVRLGEPTAPAKRAPGRPRKPVVAADSLPKLRGRPPSENPTYKNPDALRAYKRDIYDTRGYLVHKIRTLAAKHGMDYPAKVDYVRQSPAALTEILRTMLIEMFHRQQELITAGSRDAIVQRRPRSSPNRARELIEAAPFALAVC